MTWPIMTFGGPISEMYPTTRQPSLKIENSANKSITNLLLWNDFANYQKFMEWFLGGPF